MSVKTFVSCSVNSLAGDNKPVNQTAYIESSVTISCSYPRTDINAIKLFCKEDENFDCKDLVSARTANLTKRDRFLLKDNKHQRVFTVSISTLTQDDAGRYKCALKRLNNSSLQCYTEIHLSILSEYGFAIDCAECKLTHTTQEREKNICTEQ